MWDLDVHMILLLMMSMINTVYNLKSFFNFLLPWKAILKMI